MTNKGIVTAIRQGKQKTKLFVKQFSESNNCIKKNFMNFILTCKICLFRGIVGETDAKTFNTNNVYA